jgi:hypothetical protein
MQDKSRAVIAERFRVAGDVMPMRGVRNCVAISKRAKRIHSGDVVSPAASVRASASLRRQSRHRQSWSARGIGSRADSAAHQHAASPVQENSVPQLSQASRRALLPNQLFMVPTDCLPRF